MWIPKMGKWLGVLLNCSCLLLLFVLTSCRDEVFLQINAFDFTKENEFTNGIEGPLVVGDSLFIVNYQRQGTIGLVDAKGECHLFLELPEGSVGNSIQSYGDGLIVADYVGHRILQIETSVDVTSTLVESKAFNQPNDLAVHPTLKVIYASDPDWNKSSGKLWRWDKKNGLVCLEENIGTANGVCVSQDGYFLYLNESVQRNIWRYRLDSSGNILSKELFAQFTDHGLDGMKCDQAGNLYVTRYGNGKILIYNNQKKRIGEVLLRGDKPTNICLGKTSGYVTMQDRGCVESFILPDFSMSGIKTIRD